MVVNVVVCDAQIVGEDGLIEIVGFGLAINVNVEELEQLFVPVPLTEYVVVIVGDTVMLLVAALVFHV